MDCCKIVINTFFYVFYILLITINISNKYLTNIELERWKNDL